MARLPDAMGWCGLSRRCRRGAAGATGRSAEASGRVRWFARVSARAAYDLLPETGLGKSFSTVPGRWIYERRVSLGETEDFALRRGGLEDHVR